MIDTLFVGSSVFSPDARECMLESYSHLKFFFFKIGAFLSENIQEIAVRILCPFLILLGLLVDGSSTFCS